MIVPCPGLRSIYPSCSKNFRAWLIVVRADVEFATCIGLWQALENCQSEFFGTPLPLFLEVGEPLAGRFDPRRVRRFLYIL
jgi:hypothetical protein